MSNCSDQSIKNGNNNQQAGRDINIYNSNDPLTFYEKDIKKVIVTFSKQIEKIEDFEDDLLEDFKRIDIEKKNNINNLSEDYFEIIKQEYMEYFHKIRSFLMEPKNKEYLKMYKRTVVDLRNKISIRRTNYNKFEKFFEVIYDYILEECEDITFERELIWLFLTYMYFNCDIGKKVND